MTDSIFLRNVILKRAGKTVKSDGNFRYIDPHEIAKGFNRTKDYFIRYMFNNKSVADQKEKELFQLNITKVIGKVINLQQNKYGDLVGDIEFNPNLPLSYGVEGVSLYTPNEITGLGSCDIQQDPNDPTVFIETNYEFCYAVIDITPIEFDGVFMAA